MPQKVQARSNPSSVRRWVAEQRTRPRRARLLAALAPAAGIDVPGVGVLEPKTAGWQRLAGQLALEVKYLLNGRVVAYQLVGEAEVPSTTPSGESIEVVFARRSKASLVF